MSTNDKYIADEALIRLVQALAIEVTTHGSNESELMFSSTLTDDELAIIMKANTFLSAFSAILIQIVEKQNPGFAKLVMDVWTSEPIQNLVQLAFAEEIAEAAAQVQEGIMRLEQEINREEK